VDAGKTAQNRVLALAAARRGYEMARSIGLRPHSHAISPPHFCSRGTLRVSLLRLQKRRQHPERYAQFRFVVFSFVPRAGLCEFSLIKF
jgi:hypothetical protein